VVPKETVMHGMTQQCARCGHRHTDWADMRALPAGGDPAKMLVCAAELGEKQPSWFDSFRRSGGLDPADPVMAWWSISCMDLVDSRTGEVRSTVRELVCVDVDERVYTVMRHRHYNGPAGAEGKPEPVSTSLDTLDAYRAKTRRYAGTGVVAPGPATGLPMMTEGLVRCVRLCRDEQQVRGALRAAGLGGTPG
jgi:hypothetical protein